MGNPFQTRLLDAAQVHEAAEILCGDGLVAFPTETVYGLGANALSASAVEKIFRAKQRPHWDPLIVHIGDLAQLPQIASAGDTEMALMKAFWPGPLTLLLPRTSAVPDLVTAGRPLVGVRIPAHELALSLLRETGLPIAAPSANTFGHTSPTTAAHVLADLEGRIDAVLDGGPTEVGLESTVAEVGEAEVVIYRQGAVTAAMIAGVLGVGWLVRLHTAAAAGGTESQPAPGLALRHYAPRARLILVEDGSSSGLETVMKELAPSEQTGVLLPEGWKTHFASVCFAWGPWEREDILAHSLYSGLRWLDEQGCTVIVCPVPHGQGMAEAIRDRLRRAAQR